MLDTNVIISAMLSPGGTCARVLAAASGKFTVVLDERIVAEYLCVAGRPKLNIAPHESELILKQLESFAEKVTAPPAGISLPDETDVKFVEVALAAGADCVVTGNGRHFPAKACRKVRILTPAQFLTRLTDELSRP